MQFQIKRDILIKSLSVAHNIIERKSTLPILGNVLLETKNNVLTIIATDLDLLFRDDNLWSTFRKNLINIRGKYNWFKAAKNFINQIYK